MMGFPSPTNALRPSRQYKARVYVRLAPILCTAYLAGCNTSEKLVPVEGAVTLDGRPLAGANVTLSPVRATSPGPFRAKTDSQGWFALASTDNKRGVAAAGEYFLIITTVELPPGGDELSPRPKEKEIVPPEYRSGTMRFKVPAGGTKEANFAMQSGER